MLHSRRNVQHFLKHTEHNLKFRRIADIKNKVREEQELDAVVEARIVWHWHRCVVGFYVHVSLRLKQHGLGHAASGKLSRTLFC